VRWLLALAGLVAAVVACTARAATGQTHGAAWFDRGMHVVGGPVAAEGRVLVLVSAANKSVWLEAVDPHTGKVAWKVPEAFSLITPGVEVAPLAHGRIALAIVPDVAANGLVRLEGIDISSGATKWKSQAAVVVRDAPTSCPKPLGKRAFCVVAEGSSFPPTLIAISTVTGSASASVPNIERQMGPDVYEAVSVEPVLVGVRTPGGVAWAKTVKSLFGPDYGPNYGWNFDTFGSVDVAEVGMRPVGKTLNLGTSMTLGLDAATGKRMWVEHASFECGGAMGIRAPFLCAMTGTASFRAGHLALSKNATGVLEGFVPATGKITWRVPIGHLAPLLMGNIEVKDEHHVLVWPPHGQPRLLDLVSGTTTLPNPGQIFWCMKENIFKIRPPKGISASRVGSSFVTPCDASGRSVGTVVPPPGDAVATVDGMVVWASPAGLHGRPSG
jgi:hypothetical protein